MLLGFVKDIFKCQIYILVFSTVLSGVYSAMTMKQIEKTLETLRETCSVQYPSLPKDLLDSIKTGGFVEGNKDLKCYVRCIADAAGTTTKKGDLDYKKSMAQIETLLPLEIKDHAKAALNICKDTGKGYKDPCEKVFYSAKCTYEVDPAKFMFP